MSRHDLCPAPFGRPAKNTKRPLVVVKPDRSKPAIGAGSSDRPETRARTAYLFDTLFNLTRPGKMARNSNEFGTDMRIHGDPTRFLLVQCMRTRTVFVGWYPGRDQTLGFVENAYTCFVPDSNAVVCNRLVDDDVHGRNESVSKTHTNQVCSRYAGRSKPVRRPKPRAGRKRRANVRNEANRPARTRREPSLIARRMIDGRASGANKRAFSDRRPVCAPHAFIHSRTRICILLCVLLASGRDTRIYRTRPGA